MKSIFGSSYKLLIDRIKRRYGVNDWRAFALFRQLLEKANMSEEMKKFVEEGKKRREEGDLKRAGKNHRSLTGFLSSKFKAFRK